MKGLIGKKLGMTTLFDEDGFANAVTLVECPPCPVLQVKTVDKEGYNAVQIGFGRSREKRATKAFIGHCKKGGSEPVQFIREFKMDDVAKLEAGKPITVDIFENVKWVDVTGFSKGRGFTGTIKRYHFKRGRESHGNKNHRAPGSVGNHTFPARTWPGKRLPGRYGNEQVTIKALRLLKIDKEKNLLALKGCIPGPVNGLVIMQESTYRQKG